MKLHKLLNHISLKISLLLFNQRLPLSYIFFNKIYKLLILKNKRENKVIDSFHREGYAKLKINLAGDLSKFMDSLKILKKEISIPGEKINKRQLFELENSKRLEFKNFLETGLSSTINDLSKYYQSNVFIGNVMFFRINNENTIELKNKEVYSNYFHQDAYLFTYVKIFVNLMDVEKNDGPLEIVSINNRSKFIKNFKYKDRNNYSPYSDQSLVYKNIGKMGDCFLFSSPQCFHKAGIPNNHRDIMQVILVVAPKKYEKILTDPNKVNIFEENKEIFYLTKPYSIFNTVKLLIEYLFYSIKYNYD